MTCLHNLVYNLFSCAGASLDFLYIMAFTASDKDAGSDVRHAVAITLADGVSSLSLLPKRKGNDYLRHKGDLWKISFENHFLLANVSKYDIKSIAIMEDGNDGWKIETIVTFFKSGNDYELATSDFHVDSWIDGNGDDSRRRLELTLVY